MVTKTQWLYDDHAADKPGHTGDDYTDGCPTCYPPEYAYEGDFGWNLTLARSRGYDSAAHFQAILDEDEDAIALTHPTNWLTEEEVENDNLLRR